MKTINYLVIFFFLTILCNFSSAQVNHFIYKEAFNDIAVSGDTFWISSSKSGLIKWQNSGNETIYINETNSGLISSRITCLYIDQNENLWIGTDMAGVMKYDGTNWVSFTSENSELRTNWISAINEDQEGNIWLAIYNEGVTKISPNGTLTNFYTYINPELEPDTFHSIFVDQSGKIYFGWSILAIYHESSWQVYNYDDIGASHFTAMDEDNEGNIWLVSSSFGLTKFDGEEFTVYNTNNSNLPTDDLRDIYIDENNTVWIASSGNGLLKFDGETFDSFIPIINGVDIKFLDKITTNSSNQIYVLGYNSFIEFDGSTFRNHDLNDVPFQISFVNDIVIENQETQISTNNSFLTLENNIWIDEMCSSTSSNSSHTNIFDTLFIASNDGLLKYKGEEWINYHSSNSNISANQINCLTSDTAGTIWFSPKDNGLQTYKNGIIQNVQINGNLASNTILHLHYDSNDILWAGTFRNGLSYYKNGIWYTQNLDDSDPAKFQYITDIAENNQGHVYISTYSGIVKAIDTVFQIVNRNSTSAIAIDQNDNLWTYSAFSNQPDWLIKYTETDSTLYNPLGARIDFDQINTMSFDNEGYLWIGYSILGVVKLDVNNMLHNEISSPTNIEENNLQQISGIVISPNPSINIFELKSKTKAIQHLEIYNLKGQLILNKQTDSKETTIDLAGYSKGLYIVSYTIEGIKFAEKIVLK